jgi:hypothetical protein
MEEVKCPRCKGTGDIPGSGAHEVVLCFICGGHGVIDPQDLAWKRKWADQTKPALKAGSKTKTVMKADSETNTMNTHTMSSAQKAAAKKASNVAVAKRAAVDLAEEQTGRTPLHLDASDGFLRGVQELLAQGADANARDKDGRTPLHWPSYRGHLEVVRLLIEHGAEINARENQGRTPLKMAMIGNHAPVIDYLKECGAEE